MDQPSAGVLALLRDRTFRRHLRIVRRYAWMYAVAILAQVAQTGVAIVVAEILRRVFDRLPSTEGLGILIGALGGLAVFRMVATYVEAGIGSRLNETVVYELRRDVLNHLQHLPLGFHERQHSSDATNILYHDLELAKNLVVADVQNLISLPVSFIVAGTYLLTVHPALGLVALCVGPLQLLSNLVLKGRFKEAIRLQRQVTRDVFFTIGETLQGIREVKANQMEPRIDEQMQDIQRRGVDYNVLLSKTRAVRAIAREIPKDAGQLVGILIGAGLVANGHIGVGSLVAFISLLDRVSAPFTTMVQVIGNLQQAAEGAKRLYEVMDMPIEDKQTGLPLPTTPPAIEFRNVSFAYDEDRAVLSDVSFSVAAGQSLALVGPSGSGKSTLIKLLFRFYEPTSGEILIDGRPLSEYAVESLREKLALVSQEIFLFDATVADNIAAGRQKATREDIERAANLAEANEFIQALPTGYDSEIGERGIKLSHGQKQRLSIARAVLRDASVLILDEPTSALDVETEASFQRNLGQWAQHCTKLVVAHRLTTIRDCDVTLFLDAGRVAEFGPSEELVKQDGRFAAFWRLQAFQAKN